MKGARAEHSWSSLVTGRVAPVAAKPREANLSFYERCSTPSTLPSFPIVPESRPSCWRCDLLVCSIFSTVLDSCSRGEDVEEAGSPAGVLRSEALATGSVLARRSLGTAGHVVEGARFRLTSNKLCRNRLGNGDLQISGDFVK